MNKFKSLFMFTSDQRKGIFALLCILITLQFVYHFVDFTKVSNENPKAKKEWLAQQIKIDSIVQINKLEAKKIRPFNPNFITDFKGYKLGMSVEEIDRLLAFRKLDKYVNSPKEFQEVTKISDSLLAKIAPYFKFPDWVNKKKSFTPFEKNYTSTKEKIVLIDINLATQEELIKVYGVGEVISKRILEHKERFGSFVSMEQIEDVWGLSPDVVENINKRFKILTVPTVQKLKINEASIKDLMKFPYFKYNIAKNIVTYRSMNGEIKNNEDLTKIKDFPVEKIKIIALYLEF